MKRSGFFLLFSRTFVEASASKDPLLACKYTPFKSACKMRGATGKRYSIPEFPQTVLMQNNVAMLEMLKT